MKLSRFDGGLNTRLDPHLLQPTAARQLVNVNVNKAVLSPEKDKTLAVAGVSRYNYFSVSDNRWYTSDTPADFLEFKEVTYKADRTNAPVKLIDGVEYQLGLTAPTGTVTVTPTSAPSHPKHIEFRQGNTGGSGRLVEGEEYEYKLVAVHDITGLESFSYQVEPSFETTGQPVESVPNILAGKLSASTGSLFSSITGLNAISALNTVTNSGLSSSISGYKFKNFLPATVEATYDTIIINCVTDLLPDLSAFIGFYVYRFYQGAWYRVKETLTVPTAGVTDDTLDISGNTRLDEIPNITGTLQYAITFYDSSTGAESAPLVTSDVEVTKGWMDLSDIPVSSDPQVDTVRIYRIGGNLTAFSLVDSISNGTTTYRDTLADTEIVGTILTSTDNEPAPVGLKYLTEAYAMLFGALNDKLYFTPIGEPDTWPSTYFLDFPAEITGVAKTAIGLLVFTYYQTFLVTGTGPTVFAQQPLANDQGCISHDSIQETKDTAIWASTDGICISDGSEVKVISRDSLDKLSLVVAGSALYDQVYYLLQQSGAILALDFDRGIFKQFDYGVDSLVVANDTLYGHNTENLYELRSSGLLQFVYESPDFVGEGLTVAKVYSDVYVYCSGDISITPYINGIAVVTRTFTGEKLHEIKLPKDKHRGNFISFLITGTGTVRELFWVEAVANA